MDEPVVVSGGLGADLIAGPGLSGRRRHDGIDDREEEETPRRDGTGSMDAGRPKPAREIPDRFLLIDAAQTPVGVPDWALIRWHREGPLPPVLRVPGEVTVCDDAVWWEHRAHRISDHSGSAGQEEGQKTTRKGR